MTHWELQKFIFFLWITWHRSSQFDGVDSKIFTNSLLERGASSDFSILYKTKARHTSQVTGNLCIQYLLDHYMWSNFGSSYKQLRMNCPGSRNITPEKLKVSPVTKFYKLSYEEIGKLSISIALFFTNDTKSRLATQTGDSRGPCMLSIVLEYKRIHDISRQQLNVRTL